MRVLSRLRSFSGRGAGGERGAVATVVAILLAGGVVIGMLAVSVDIGNLTYERRQVQNAADATALALASTCAADADDCDPADPDVEGLLDANSRDEASQYASRPDAPGGACARGDADQVGPLAAAACTSAASTADIGALLECPPLPDWLAAEPGIPYVETYAATETATGDDALFLPFSRVLVGGESGDKGTGACARAAWGMPKGYSGAMPLTLSSCEWKQQTNDGEDYVENGPVGAKPGYGSANPWPDPSREIVISTHDPKDETSDCYWNGKDTGGGFGWLDQSGACEAAVSEDDWVKIDTGNNVPNGCKTKLEDLRNTVVDLPVFDCIVASKDAPVGGIPASASCDPTNPESSGNNTWYHLAGWAKFYVSGYYLTGSDSGSTMPGGHSSCPAGGGGRCLMGWFVTGALSDAPDIAPPGSGDDFGTYVVRPAG